MLRRIRIVSEFIVFHPCLSACLPEAGRRNIYNTVHKALRLGHCRMLATLGAHDFSDAAGTTRLMELLQSLIGLNRSHLMAEAQEVQAAQSAQRTAVAHEDHGCHLQSLAEIESLIRAVSVATASRRGQVGQVLYQHYAHLVSADLEHMHRQETARLSQLHQAFSDDELLVIENRIAASMQPAPTTFYLSLMMAALNQDERVEILAKLQKDLPELTFSGLLADAVKPALAANDFAAAMGALMLHAA
jgi:hypothetical protein